MAGAIHNIAGYRFVDLDDRDELQHYFRSICEDLGLKGTILLAMTEGWQPRLLNLFAQREERDLVDLQSTSFSFLAL